MEPFLDRLARVLLQHHGHELDRIAVVLPGRRAGLYLRKYLAQRSGKALWSPEMLDVGAFMERLTGMRQGVALELLFMLHEAHRALAGERAESLVEFMRWAPTTLRDISEADAHLLPLDKLYRDLRAYTEIDEWSFRLNKPLSPGQERMLHQWAATGELHQRMASLMVERGIGTSGALSRHAAELAQAGSLLVPWNTVWFAGLNALDPATTAVAEHLVNVGKAQLAWDADHHYLTDAGQEAGRFLRRSIKDLGPGSLPPIGELRTRSRKLVVVTVPNKVAQARYAAQWLAELDPAQRADTAVVLADEDLLMPLLEAMPAGIGPLNVTMGLPFAALPAQGLVEALLDLHIASPGGGDLHVPSLEPLLLHPFLHQGQPSTRTIAALRRMQRTRLRADELIAIATQEGMEAHDAMRKAIAPHDGTLAHLPARINALLAWAKAARAGDPFAEEQLFRMARAQRQFEQALARQNIVVSDLASYALLRKRVLSGERMDFLGEPLMGLQVMGFLETRAIDHTRILLLGANEGTLPRADGPMSWIPFEIRRTYGLPLRSDTEAITAYHFNRMLHLADEVHAVCDPGSAEGSGEISRFLKQWQHEMDGSTGTLIHQRSMVAPSVRRPASVIAVAKDARVLERIDAMAARGISPSALGTWLRCPLDFYFSRVLGIQPPDGISELLGSDVLGEAVHQVLEDIFRPLLGKALVPEHLRMSAASVAQELHGKLSGKFSLDTLARGHFRLRIEMAQQAVASYLHAEAQRAEREESTPLHLELDIRAALPNGTVLAGRVDRIEERDGITCVLDLKTGNVQAKDLLLKGLEREHFGADQRYALQLLIYAWIVLQNDPSLPSVRAGIIPLQRTTQSEGLWLKLNGSMDITRDHLPATAALLTGLIDEMRDPATPFVHDPESRWCTCCIS